VRFRKKRNIKRSEIEAARKVRRRRVYRGLLGLMYVSLALAGVAGVVQTRRVLLASPMLRLKEVEVEGNHRVSPWEVKVLGGLEPGRSLLSIDVRVAAAGIKRHPWVAGATVRRVFPDRVLVTLQEREPAALLAGDSLYYVDRTGVVFQKVGPDDRMDFPVLTGFDRPGPLQTARVGRVAVVEAVALIEQIGTMTPLERSQISEVHVDPDEGFSFYTTLGPARIHLGWDEFPVKLSRLSLLLEQERLSLARVQEVDLDLRAMAVVTPNEASRRKGGHRRGHRAGMRRTGR